MNHFQSSNRQKGRSPQRWITGLLLAFIGWAGAGSTTSLALDICGDIACDDTWQVADSPYNVTCSSTVTAGCTLTIEAGVEVRFQPGTGLTIHGALDVNGIPGTEVLFHSDAATPVVGDWVGLRFELSGTGTIDNARITYPVDGIYLQDNADVELIGVEITDTSDNGVEVNGNGALATIVLTGVTVSRCNYGVYVYGNASATLTDVTTTNNAGHGVYVYDASTTLTDVMATGNGEGGVTARGGSATLNNVTADQNQYGLYLRGGNGEVNASDCTFTGNHEYGVWVYGLAGLYYKPELTIINSSIHSNLGDYDFFSSYHGDYSTKVLDLTGNWWGTTDELAIRSRICDSANCPFAPMVNWSGYLDGPGGSAIIPDYYPVFGPIIDETVVWAQTDKPYVLITDVKVRPTGVLQVEPGVQIQGMTGVLLRLLASGSLDVNGVPGNEVTFTSYPADTYWGGVAIGSGGLGVIDNARISYAKYGLANFGEVYLNGGEINHSTYCATGTFESISDLSGVTLNQCSRGFDLRHDSVATLTDVTVTGCITGMAISDSTASLSNVKIADNTGTGISASDGDVDFGEYGYSIITMNNVSLTGNAYDGLHILGGVTATLKNVTMSMNDEGMHVEHRLDANGTWQTPKVDATGCTFTGNRLYGVYTSGEFIEQAYSANPPVKITNSSIHSNLGSYDYYADHYFSSGSYILWAPDNWWGTTNQEQIRDRIHDYEDNPLSPRVWFKPVGEDCEEVLGGDQDGDGLGDFEDNCPVDANTAQLDTDDDGMGDLCDPEPGMAPAAACDGINDMAEGYADTDGDDWGDPCDFQPTRDDCYPGATEICDGRDNDGDALFGIDELIDADFDEALFCAGHVDCDDSDSGVYPCACENCDNLIDDDCDTFSDGDDSECSENPYCILLTATDQEPELQIDRNVCGSSTHSGPFEVIRGFTTALQIISGHVDLGDVTCVDDHLSRDRITDYSVDSKPGCIDPMFYLAREEGTDNFGSAIPGDEPRDLMTPDPPCP